MASLQELEALRTEESFETYFLLLVLSEFDVAGGDWQTSLKEIRHSHSELLDRLAKETVTVEIHRDAMCYRVNFRTPPLCQKMLTTSLFRELTVKRTRDIPRDDPDEKVWKLLNTLSSLVADVEYIEWLQNSSLFWWTVEYRYIVKEMPYNIALVIIFLAILFYGSPHDPWGTHDGKFRWLDVFMQLLLCASIVANLMANIVFFVVDVPTQGTLSQQLKPTEVVVQKVDTAVLLNELPSKRHPEQLQRLAADVQKLPCFSRIGRNKTAKLLKNARLRMCVPGEVLYVEGGQPDVIYCQLEGLTFQVKDMKAHGLDEAIRKAEEKASETGLPVQPAVLERMPTKDDSTGVLCDTSGNLIQYRAGRVWPDVSWDRNIRPTTVICSGDAVFIEVSVTTYLDLVYSTSEKSKGNDKEEGTEVNEPYNLPLLDPPRRRDPPTTVALVVNSLYLSDSLMSATW